MKLFISWSGNVSHEVALHLKEWLPVVLPFVEPWVSSEDIPKGARWSPEVARQLEATNSGILCLVAENVREPWINFEAGALSKSIDTARIHPFLLGLDPSQLPGPLGQFQATRFEQNDVRKLTKALNSEAGSPLSDDHLTRNFDTCWPDLERRLTPLLKPATTTSSPPTAKKPPSAASPPKYIVQPEDLAMLRAIANSSDGLKKDDVGSMHPQRAQHIMERLEQVGLLTAEHNYLYGTTWHLSQKGRAFLVERNLL